MKIFLILPAENHLSHLGADVTLQSNRVQLAAFRAELKEGRWPFILYALPCHHCSH